MRICFICSEYPPAIHGGIGTFVQVMGRALAKAGHQVRVVGSYGASCAAPQAEEDQGVRVHRLRRRAFRGAWLLERYQLYRTVRQWSQQGEIDLVEVTDWESSSAGWPRLPVPLISRLQGSASYFALELGRPLHPLTFRLERAALRRADFWCSASQYTAEKTQALFQYPKGEPVVLYNPVETDIAPSTQPRSDRHVVFTGTLTPKKGVISLFKAWPLVIHSFPQAQLQIFGKDATAPGIASMKSHLTSLLPEDIRASVTFYGHVPRPTLYQALQTARLAVFPSYSESFGIAPVEAMTTGCPTIYTRRGVGPEVVADGRDGLLVDPDQPQEIAQTILRLLTDHDLARQLGIQGRARVVEAFSTEKLLLQNEAFYQRCVHNYRA